MTDPVSAAAAFTRSHWCLARQRSGARDDDERLLRRRPLRTSPRSNNPFPNVHAECALTTWPPASTRSLVLDHRSAAIPASGAFVAARTTTGDFNIAARCASPAGWIVHRAHDTTAVGSRARSLRASASRSHRGRAARLSVATAAGLGNTGPRRIASCLAHTHRLREHRDAASRALSDSNGNYNSAFAYLALRLTRRRLEHRPRPVTPLRGNTTRKPRTPPPASTRCRPTRRVSTTSLTAISLWSSTRPVAQRGAGGNALLSNTDGDDNIAIGDQALFNNKVADAASPSAQRAAPQPGRPQHRDRGPRPAPAHQRHGQHRHRQPGVTAETKTIRIGTQGTQTRAFHAGIDGTADPRNHAARSWSTARASSARRRHRGPRHARHDPSSSRGDRRAAPPARSR